MQINKKYPLQVWLLTCLVLVPVYLTGESLIYMIHENSGEPKTVLIGYAISVMLYGSIYSSPAFGLLYLAFYFLTKKGFSSFLVKSTLLGLSLILILIASYILLPSDNHVTPVYFLGALIAGFFFQVYKTR